MQGSVSGRFAAPPGCCGRVFFGSVFGRAGALVFCSIFSCRAWRARGAGRRRAGAAGGRRRGWCAAVALRRCAVACVGARAVAWCGAARGAVALRFCGAWCGRALLVARVFALLRFEKKFLRCRGGGVFLLSIIFWAGARVCFFFDARSSLRRCVRCCFA